MTITRDAALIRTTPINRKITAHAQFLLMKYVAWFELGFEPECFETLDSLLTKITTEFVI